VEGQPADEGVIMDLREQRVVVLGGTSGIGLAVATAASRRGARVTVVSSNKSRVDRAVAELAAGASGQAVDLTDTDAVQALFDGLGAIDHLVYTAGEPLALMPVDGLDLERARQFFELRYFGALAAVRAAAPHLPPGGSITLTSGTAGDRPGPGWSVASSICGALASLTRALAVELAPIRVNAVAPGVVRSPLWDSMDDADREQFYSETAAAIPLGRVGEIYEIAEAYLFFVTQEFSTGSILTLDGGSVLA
jgi:NAD(P)-dependent dehydrogenase (short-subunit alcohol dehydrogenase family)